MTFTLLVDGTTHQITTTAATVGEALEEAGIAIAPSDEVEPPATTELAQQTGASPLNVTITRVTETIEVVPESIPFQRRIVRSAEMSPDDPPRILQTGAPGLREVSLRLVFRDGLEAERWPLSVSVVEPAVDEIVMIGVNSARETTSVSGRLAYLNNGRAIILEGSTDLPRQLSIDGAFDGRVFQLSPDGQYLLYTLELEATEQAAFHNELWVAPVAEGGQPRALDIENVLWAAWDPSAIESPRIGYTTARSVSLPPGWEAINDLWLLPLPADGAPAVPIRIVESYPATLGWWGGTYAWSPDGSQIAYAFADQIGLLNLPEVLSAIDANGPADIPQPTRTVLHTFAEYETGADWAWLPAVGWSADSRFLSFTTFVKDEDRFDLWLADTIGETTLPFVEGVGIWSAVQWSSPDLPADSRLAYLQTVAPDGDEDSTYALWVTGSDGSDRRRVFPPQGEAGQFARTSSSLTWGPDGNQVAFVFDDELHLLDLATGDLFRAGEDDTVSSHPTWAPYGAAVTP
ncbi:MAG: DUF348 domain-containing protein [Anaerolineales bacterium]|uniref:ubiquitin-like domain-containing protein n=1 Tax=Promineifilum sp. TaxID=2664178 RepID=UPI001DEB0E96|nr:DUF348 domain-containing protein [Anaerolineales bacterium]MCO5179122.1 ubiquitin-like domain-containing protein [Promineifilum sp.]